jgi:hypothetical protein
MSQKYLFVTLYLYSIFWYSDIIPKSDVEVIFIILNRAVSVRNDVRTTDKNRCYLQVGRAKRVQCRSFILFYLI